MTDLLFAALNNHLHHLTPEQSDAITERWNALQADPLFTEGERSEIFKVFVKNTIWKEEPEVKPVEPTPTVPKRCKICGMVAEAGWRYIGPRTLDIICLHCQERQRIQNRPAGTGQRTLL